MPVHAGALRLLGRWLVMTAGRCNETCLEDVCTCQPVREFPDRLDRIAQQERELQRIKGTYDELVTDEAGRITLQRASTTLRAVSAKAVWPGGIGEESVFGEAGR